eukprot:sb/3466671/
MSGICNNFKRTGKCRFGDNCKFQHVRGGGGKRKIARVTCPRFSSKEGNWCQGDCKLAHAFEQDTELLGMFERGINIINIRVNDVKGKMRDQASLQDMYDLPVDLVEENTGPTTSIDINLDPTSISSLNANAVSFHPTSSQERDTTTTSTENFGGGGGSSLGGGGSSLAGAKVVTTLTGDEYTREVQQVTRLYRDHCQLHETDSGTLIQLQHKPTDPDWNLTITEISLDLFVPVSYPATQCTLEFSDDRVSERTEDRINAAIAEELVLREGSLCVRPLLRWIDRNIGDMLQVETQLRTALSLAVHRHGGDESDSESGESDGEGGHLHQAA